VLLLCFIFFLDRTQIYKNNGTSFMIFGLLEVWTGFKMNLEMKREFLIQHTSRAKSQPRGPAHVTIVVYSGSGQHGAADWLGPKTAGPVQLVQTERG
jgi:hypothetical protein